MSLPAKLDDILSLENDSSLVRIKFKGEIDLADYNLVPFVPNDKYTSKDFFIPKNEDTLDFRAEITEICRQGKFTGKHEKFDGAVYEAFRNAYQHGNHKDPKKKVTLSYRTTPENFEVVVSDQGGKINGDFIPFVLMHRQGHLQTPYSFYKFARNAKQKPENSGIGTYILHMVSDEVNYFTNPDHGLSVQLVIRKSSP